MQYSLAIRPDFRDHSFDVNLDELLEKARALSSSMLTAPEMSAEEVSLLFESTMNMPKQGS